MLLNSRCPHRLRLRGRQSDFRANTLTGKNSPAYMVAAMFRTSSSSSPDSTSRVNTDSLMPLSFYVVPFHKSAVDSRVSPTRTESSCATHHLVPRGVEQLVTDMGDLLLPLLREFLETRPGRPARQTLHAWESLDRVLAGGADRLRYFRKLFDEPVVPRVSVDKVDAVDDAQDDCRECAVGGTPASEIGRVRKREVGRQNVKCQLLVSAPGAGRGNRGGGATYNLMWLENFSGVSRRLLRRCAPTCA